MSIPTLSQAQSTFILSMLASVTTEKGQAESHAPHGGSHSSSHSYNEKLENIMASIQDISTKISGLASLMHSHHIRCDTKFISLQTQLE